MSFSSGSKGTYIFSSHMPYRRDPSAWSVGEYMYKEDNRLIEVLIEFLIDGFVNWIITRIYDGWIERDWKILKKNRCKDSYEK